MGERTGRIRSAIAETLAAIDAAELARADEISQANPARASPPSTASARQSERLLRPARWWE